MPVSTMGLGIDPSGRVERYQPPKVIEEGGGGGPPPGPGPLLQSPAWTGSVAGGAFGMITSFTLPAGTHEVWAVVTCNATGMAINNYLSLSLDGTSQVAASTVQIDNTAGSVTLLNLATRPVEVTLPAAQAVHIALQGMAAFLVTAARIYARQLA